MTIPLLEVSFNRMFEFGQAYVALSRATSLQGLTLRSFQPNAVRAHPTVKTFYQALYEQQRQHKQEQVLPSLSVHSRRISLLFNDTPALSSVDASSLLHAC